MSAFGLLPFGITMLQARVFYALTDSRTPTLIQLVTVAVKIPMLLLCRGAAAAAGRGARPGRGEQRIVPGRSGVSGSCCCAAGWAGSRPPGCSAPWAGRCWRLALLGGLLAFAAVSLAGGPLAGFGPPARAWLELTLAVLIIDAGHGARH